MLTQNSYCNEWGSRRESTIKNKMYFLTEGTQIPGVMKTTSLKSSLHGFFKCPSTFKPQQCFRLPHLQSTCVNISTPSVLLNPVGPSSTLLSPLNLPACHVTGWLRLWPRENMVLPQLPQLPHVNIWKGLFQFGSNCIFIIWKLSG